MERCRTCITQNKDMELVGVFTRRNPEAIKLLTKEAKAIKAEAKNMTDIIDVMIYGGSKSDIPFKGLNLPPYLIQSML